ncbi:MAG: adenosylcobinamide-GDP ribazoletransferase [Chloracidobacterium sp.]|uniref:Adenosylcobinamide-GDP ribazoletransferase n=1 Tax=Chloracidobacterium validum TaxID=2821543 RepID=A0ABX8B7W0_9BACT|nr:adenosylcobinamide-GDP ribazoletransferase [Chloracidobacterium validum]QUW03042.1 adenosylcobinamide-GDP ribazoletransferase [Chloracidobacterium validum]
MMGLRLFLAAVAFLTRLPVPAWAHPDPKTLAAAMACFPLVGAGLGLGQAGCALALWPLLSPEALAVLLIASSVLVTGALHYDGLADTVDALGGGWSREQRLAIMKDPHIGTFGVLALVLAGLAQFVALKSFQQVESLCRALIVAPCLARLTIVWLAWQLPYARAEGGKGRFVMFLHGGHVLGAALIGSAIVLGIGGRLGSLLLALAATLTLLAGWYFRRQLGGITGDALGAVSQTCEIMAYGVWVTFQP